MGAYAVAQEEIEDAGGEKEVGAYRVGYIVEPAEGWWDGNPTVLQWRGPSGAETNHIEILPFEAESGLLVPDMRIDLTILYEAGEVVESKPLKNPWSFTGASSTTTLTTSVSPAAAPTL